MSQYGKFLGGIQRPSQDAKSRWIARQTKLWMPQATKYLADEVVAQLCAMYPHQAVAALPSRYAEHGDNALYYTAESSLSPCAIAPSIGLVHHWMRLGYYGMPEEATYGYVPVILDHTFLGVCVERALKLLHQRKPSGVALGLEASIKMTLAPGRNEVKLIAEYTAHVPIRSREQLRLF